MITVVYVVNEGEAIMAAAFLMEGDADVFMREQKYLTMYKVSVNGWDGWSLIRNELAKEVDNT